MQLYTACDRKHARRKVIQASPACINAILILYRKCFLFNSFLLLLNIFATKAPSAQQQRSTESSFSVPIRALSCQSIGQHLRLAGNWSFLSLFRSEQACTPITWKSTLTKTAACKLFTCMRVIDQHIEGFTSLTKIIIWGGHLMRYASLTFVNGPPTDLTKMILLL